ncbi:lysosomal proton-coupled steroid conjugate and bile acid symporter SLC46A3-like [Planococcus citri]|uniref:lysosomal proton-coupled steroid conjugate and bile acid symporter SLC46A3-like n=1 Tax=Planococcus citri TaxID=170843 RepID=UPI0031F99543
MRNFFKHVTVEPSLFIYFLLYDWMDGFHTNLFLQKTCRFNQTFEPDLNTPCDDETRGTLFISEISSKYRFVVALSSILIKILATCWSDEAGQRRRPLIFMPMVGQIFIALSGCLHSYFWPWSSYTAVISWVILESITGGIYLMLTACHIYVCDEQDAKNRTMKLGFIGAIETISLVLGKGGSGFILRSFGFFYSYLMCFVLSVISLIFGFVFIKDTSVPVEKKTALYHILNLKRVIANSFKIVFNKNLGRKRIIVLLQIIANVAVYFTMFGELSVLYPYLRYRFSWDERQFSTFLLYRFSLATVGILFCSIVLSKCLKVHDGLIGILAGSFDLIAIVALLFASQIWQIYLIPLMDLFHGTTLFICISFMSKYYNASALGRLNAVNGALSVLLPLSFPAYNTIYHETFETFPSAFCLLSVVLDIGIILCFCASYFLDKKLDSEKPVGVQDETRDMLRKNGTNDTIK